MKEFIVKLTEKASPIYIVEILNPQENNESIIPGEANSKDSEEKICPYCKNRIYFLKILHRYYCFNCKKYI